MLYLETKRRRLAIVSFDTAVLHVETSNAKISKRAANLGSIFDLTVRATVA